MGKSENNMKQMIVLLSALGSIITIFIFITGKASINDIVGENSKESGYEKNKTERKAETYNPNVEEISVKKKAENVSITNTRPAEMTKSRSTVKPNKIVVKKPKENLVSSEEIPVKYVQIGFDNGNTDKVVTETVVVPPKELYVQEPIKTEVVEKIDVNVGSICFVNTNFYPRKIVMTHKINRNIETVVIGNADYRKQVTSCAYDIPAGVYNCEVYTTFTKKKVEQFDIKIKTDKESSKSLSKNDYN